MEVDKEKLINIVKQHEFLYNKDHPLYKNKVKCTKTWQAIAESMEVAVAGKCESCAEILWEHM